MKCGQCGAINGASHPKCEFCSTNLDQPKGHEGSAVLANVSNAAPVSFARDSFNFIMEVDSTRSTPMNWWAFWAPVAYLAGYSMKDNAIKVAMVFIVPALIFRIAAHISFGLAGAVNIVNWCWTLYVMYSVSTHTEALAVKERKYELGKGVIAQLALIFVLGFIGTL